ncbi:hypothetical protein LXL04_019246 [Taraxacum kok-saghyz]
MGAISFFFLHLHQFRIKPSGNKPNYLAVQNNPPALALCPATNNCISTSENISDLIHYAPPWAIAKGRM